MSFRTEPDPWQWLAACRGMDTAIWFPELQVGRPTTCGSPSMDTTALARSICAGCIVSDICRAEALEREETSGIWGGEVFDRRFVRSHQRKLRKEI
jgi:WhiB family transcriptional regulator, redox-sensing transcriptional regulator